MISTSLQSSTWKITQSSGNWLRSAHWEKWRQWESSTTSPVLLFDVSANPVFNCTTRTLISIRSLWINLMSEDEIIYCLTSFLQFSVIICRSVISIFIFSNGFLKQKAHNLPFTRLNVFPNFGSYCSDHIHYTQQLQFKTCISVGFTCCHKYSVFLQVEHLYCLNI